MRSAIFLAGCLAVLAAVLGLDVRSARADSGGGGGGSSISTPVSVANGGTGDATTGWSSSARPASPDSRNDEFDGTAYSGWTTTFGSCAQSGTAMDPYAQFATANVYRHSWNSYWPGWFVMQGTSANVSCGIYKAITVNTNDLVWTHVRVTGFSATSVPASVSSANIILCDTSSCTHLVAAQIYYDGTNFVFQTSTDATTAKTTLALPGGVGSGLDAIIGIQKIGTSYTMYLDHRPFAAITNANAMAVVLLDTFNNYTSATPGNTLTAFDYVRFQNSATALPW